ncbi:jg13889 [Pararge aegeria aegeria]|uniref:Jg13889 protein n=1 Tax=Pararge aegeria aegeria TaxID=348720 RepID=A0A8S4S9A5_9NEOP|nr:jg13889 [Pararge aegeria aegeria]
MKRVSRARDAGRLWDARAGERLAWAFGETGASESQRLNVLKNLYRIDINKWTAMRHAVSLSRRRIFSVRWPHTHTRAINTAPNESALRAARRYLLSADIGRRAASSAP